MEEKLKNIVLIYGAKSLALGAYRAMEILYPNNKIRGFVVSSCMENPKRLAGLPVWELGEIEDRESCFLIATPEDVQGEIVQSLEEKAFYDYICMDSQMENCLMESYYRIIGGFPSLHDFPVGKREPAIWAYLAKSTMDRPITGSYEVFSWMEPLSVGAALSKIQVTGLRDDTGKNISDKNRMYCELTAHYWIWKNRLHLSDYIGAFHYRRILDIRGEDLLRLEANKIDVVLPFPLLHEPDLREHHKRYIKDEDWEAMLQALKELRPDAYRALDEIERQPYSYNYNMLLATRPVWMDYCEFLFPILEQTEKLLDGYKSAKRYIGYLGENLTTLYFRYNPLGWKIAHTGRIMLV